MKLNSQFTITSLFSALALCSACSVKTGAASDLMPHIDSSVAPTSLTGTWDSACTQSQSGSQMDQMIFNGSSFSGETFLYQDTACKSAVVGTTTFNGTYTLGSSAAHEPGAHNLDLHFNDATSGSQTFYSLALTTGNQIGALLYLPTSISPTSASRPMYVDRSKPFTRVN